jgi:hypothetical protein
VGLKVLFVVISFGFLPVFLAGFSLLAFLLYTSCVFRGALRFCNKFLLFIKKVKEKVMCLFFFLSHSLK